MNTRFRLTVTILTVFLVAGCTSNIGIPPTSSSSVSLGSWLATARPPMGLVEADFQNILSAAQDAVAKDNPSELYQACAIFGTDVKTMQGYLPSPDQELTADFAAALNDYVKYAKDCTSGQILKLAGDADAANAAFDVASARLNQLASALPNAHPSSVASSSITPITTTSPMTLAAQACGDWRYAQTQNSVDASTTNNEAAALATRAALGDSQWQSMAKAMEFISSLPETGNTQADVDRSVLLLDTVIVPACTALGVLVSK